MESFKCPPKRRGRTKRLDLRENRAEKERKKKTGTSCSQDQNLLHSLGGTSWAHGCRRDSAHDSPGQAPCLPSLPLTESKVSPAPQAITRALLPPLSLHHTTCTAHCPHPAVSALLCCAPASVWQESPMLSGPPGRFTEQSLGYRCNLPPRNVPCSNHFFKLHKHNLCTVINYLAENDASC